MAKLRLLVAVTLAVPLVAAACTDSPEDSDAEDVVSPVVTESSSTTPLRILPTATATMHPKLQTRRCRNPTVPARVIGALPLRVTS